MFPVAIRRLPVRGVVLLTAMLFLAGSSPPGAQTRKLYPVDEAGKDPSFQVFRRQLIVALRRGDRRYVLNIVDPKIVPSFGDETGGIQGFKKLWNLDERDPKGWNRLRDRLLELLALGGSFSDGAFWAPYVYSKWPDDRDSFEYAAVTGERVAVRSRPAGSAPILTRLTYDIVKLASFERRGDAAWVSIITPDGQPGYLAARFLRSPVDYRACFKKVKGQWRMTVLVAGD